MIDNVNRRSLRLRAALALLLLLASINLPSHALVVLQYHHISGDTPKSTSITPGLFAEHMRWLREHEYAVVDMGQLVAWMKQGKPLPNKAVVITFDDGYSSIYDNAWPILKKYQWPFTVFINTQHHDDKNAKYMSWKQLQEMAKGGATIGNHSVSHDHMVRRLPEETDEQWHTRTTEEIASAQKTINRTLGKQLNVFAYPYGEYNRPLQDILQQHGYLAFGQQSGPIAPFDQPTALPRFPFGGNFGAMSDFEVKVASLPMPIDKVELIAEKGDVLAEPLLLQDVQRPILRLSGPGTVLAKVQCFAGSNEVKASLKGAQLQVQVTEPLGVGRSRYNCTAPAEQGFYWYSHLMMKKYPDGRWYEEQ